MYVSVPPRLGASPAEEAAMLTIQKTAPRLAAANADVLIMGSSILRLSYTAFRSD